MPSSVTRLSNLYRATSLPQSLTSLVTAFYVVLFFISVHPLYSLYKYTYTTKITMSGSPHDLEIKAPEDLTTHHEEVKPEDSKSSTGSESHSSKNSSVTRFNEKGQRINDKGKLINDKGQLINKAGERINEKGERVNDFGETEAEETKRVCKRLSEIVDKALERLEPILDMINEVQTLLSPVVSMSYE